MEDYNKIYQISNAYASSLFCMVKEDEKLKDIVLQFELSAKIIYGLFEKNICSDFSLNSKSIDLILNTITTEYKFDNMNIYLKRLIQILFKNKRLSYIKHVFSQFEQLFLNSINTVPAVVTITGDYINYDQDELLKIKNVQKIIEIFEKKLQKKLKTHVNVDNSILSGFTVEVDHMLFNASVDSVLKRLERDLINQLNIID